jgi:hypothetical protein
MATHGVWRSLCRLRKGPGSPRRGTCGVHLFGFMLVNMHSDLARSQGLGFALKAVGYFPDRITRKLALRS